MTSNSFEKSFLRIFETCQYFVKILLPHCTGIFSAPQTVQSGLGLQSKGIGHIIAMYHSTASAAVTVVVAVHFCPITTTKNSAL